MGSSTHTGIIIIHSTEAKTRRNYYLFEVVFCFSLPWLPLSFTCTVVVILLLTALSLSHFARLIRWNKCFLHKFSFYSYAKIYSNENVVVRLALFWLWLCVTDFNEWKSFLQIKRLLVPSFLSHTSITGAMSPHFQFHELMLMMWPMLPTTISSTISLCIIITPNQRHRKSATKRRVFLGYMCVFVICGCAVHCLFPLPGNFIFSSCFIIFFVFFFFWFCHFYNFAGWKLHLFVSFAYFKIDV